jgi:hypothetical protein
MIRTARAQAERLAKGNDLQWQESRDDLWDNITMPQSMVQTMLNGTRVANIVRAGKMPDSMDICLVRAYYRLGRFEC